MVELPITLEYKYFLFFLRFFSGSKANFVLRSRGSGENSHSQQPLQGVMKACNVFLTPECKLQTWKAWKKTVFHWKTNTKNCQQKLPKKKTLTLGLGLKASNEEKKLKNQQQEVKVLHKSVKKNEGNMKKTCKTRFGKFRSSSSVICVRYVGRSNTGGLSFTSFTWITTVV